MGLHRMEVRAAWASEWPAESDSVSQTILVRGLIKRRSSCRMPLSCAANFPGQTIPASEQIKQNQDQCRSMHAVTGRADTRHEPLWHSLALGNGWATCA